MPPVFVLFGTELEKLDNEQKDGISRRPLGVQEQTACDERGRRRFHGAFTGGFSAGFFNTVGSEQGWQPKQFKSSRGERADRYDQTAEDFMDEEDLGEFGIATRRVHTALDDRLARGANKREQSVIESSLAGSVEALVRPVRESMGVRLLKKMGWRQGQGIGPKMSRRALEKHKQNEQRARGRAGGKVDEDWVKEVEEMAPGFEFAPEDVLSHYLHSRDGTKGLGYEGLAKSSVLSEQYGSLEAALRPIAKKKSKGIRGQAFGVGAFEDDDDSIYTSTDLSQYDFAIGGDDAPSTSRHSYDVAFVMAEKRQGARSFFEAPRIPPNFKPFHKPILLDIALLPEAIKKLGESMNHVQRAKFLGEVDKDAVLELIRDEDRKRFTGRGEKKDGMERMFEDEPMKQARFKQYLHYLKRGLNLPPPVEMTSLEWERELSEFQRVLPPHLRSLLPEVMARQAPLANKDLAVPIATILKSKFISASGSSHRKSEVKDEDRVTAVRMKMFGERTRLTHEWHPSKQIAKRFNVPHPFPDSNLSGVAHLQKTTKRETLLNLGSTADEVLYRAGINEQGTKETTDKDGNVHKESSNKAKDEKAMDKPPEDFFKAIFADSDDEESDEEEEEPAQRGKDQEDGSSKGKSPEKVPEGGEGPEKPAVKFVTVMDLVPSDNEEFGPAPPPQSSAQPLGTALPSYSAIRHHREENDKKPKKHKKEKHRKESKKRKSEHKKHKKHSKERRRHSSSSSSSSVIAID